MTREQVEVTGRTLVVSGQAWSRIDLFVDREYMGGFAARAGEPIVQRGLILAGFAAVEVSGAGLAPSVLELWQVRKDMHQSGDMLCARVDGRRGRVQLRRFFVKGMDELRFDVSFDGRAAWDWAPPYLDEVATLVAVLRQAAFDVVLTQGVETQEADERRAA